MWVLRDDATFASYGGRLLAAPAVVVTPGPSNSTVTYFFATGTDHHLWYRTDSADWRLLSGSAYCLDSPAALWNAARSELTVACTGSDHALWTTKTSMPAGGTPSAGTFSSLGGYLAYGPALTLIKGEVHFVVTGRDPRVWERTLSHDFQPTPWQCIGHPAAGYSGTTAYFACHGTDGALWVSRDTGVGWEAARSLGGRLIDGPGVAASPSQVDLYVEGTDHALWQATLDSSGNFQGFAGLGGYLNGGAGAGGM